MGKQTTKRYGVDPHEDIKSLCCSCVPLRLAVFLIAVFSIVTSVVVLFAKSLGVDTAAVFGGYTLQSKTCLLFIEVSGAIWGFIGAQGAVRCHANSVIVFFYYQVARCLCWVGVFYFDLPALYACEKWVTDMSSQPAWNPQMYQIAMEGLCFQKRLAFYLFNIPLFLMFSYFTYVNYKFVWGRGGLNEGITERSYANIGDKATLGIFAASSLAEHTPLNVANQWPEEPAKKPPKKGLTDDAKAWGALPHHNFGYPVEDDDHKKTAGHDKAPSGAPTKTEAKGHGKGSGTKGAADASADGPGIWSSLFGSKPATPPGHGTGAATTGP
jgi:hypothetical protein